MCQWESKTLLKCMAYYFIFIRSVISYTTTSLPIFSNEAVSKAPKLTLYDSIDADVLQVLLQYNLFFKSGCFLPPCIQNFSLTWSTLWHRWSIILWRRAPAVSNRLECLPWTMPARTQVQSLTFFSKFPLHMWPFFQRKWSTSWPSPSTVPARLSSLGNWLKSFLVLLHFNLV